MLGAGHITEYLRHWRNLYIHSQQGYEAFNALLKSFFFRRTARGGKAGQNSNSDEVLRSRLEPIGRWLQRRILWLCGLDSGDIDDGPMEDSSFFRRFQFNSENQNIEVACTMVDGGDTSCI